MAASPFHRREDPAPISEVNVVPLADVSLVLLIILLVLSPMAAQHMLKVQAAAAAAAPERHQPAELVTLREPEKTLVVAVTAPGFVLDGRLYPSTADLRSRLAAVLPGREDRKVFLVPDLETAHGRVVAALESVTAAGGSPALVQVADAEAP